MNKIKRPDAFVVVYNMPEREGSNLTIPKLFAIPEVLDISSAVISIQTNKSKAEPTGTFSISLSPNNNWVSFLSSGSWIAIHVADRKITDVEKKIFSEKTLKMIGRIDSVRASRSVDQSTGAWITRYTVDGRDWGQALENLVYLDQIAAQTTQGLALSPLNSGFGAAARLKFDQELKDIYSKQVLLSTTEVASIVMKVLGTQGLALNINQDAIKSAFNNKTTGFDIERYLPTSQLKIPIPLSLSMGKTSDLLVPMISLTSGILTGKNTYDDTNEAVGHLDVRKLLGVNSIWSVLQNTCTAGGVNELVTDLSFGKIGVNMNLFKRVRPFHLPSSSFNLTGPFKPGTVESSFLLLPHTQVELYEIMSADAGTNWRDVVNFIEILPTQTFLGKLTFTPTAFKAFNAEYNTASYAISGFKPYMVETNFLPPNSSGGQDLNGIKNWLKVMKGWFFETHKMLNGGIVFSGKSEYIQVGSNILFPTKAIANADFVKGSSGLKAFVKGNSETFILGHVEVVSHSFSVNPDGTRGFYTNLSYSRGIIVDDRINKTTSTGFGVDDKAPKLTDTVNSNTRFTS
jgi:hypothetical protein